MEDMDVLQQAEEGLNVPPWLSMNSPKELSLCVKLSGVRQGNSVEE